MKEVKDREVYMGTTLTEKRRELAVRQFQHFYFADDEVEELG